MNCGMDTYNFYFIEIRLIVGGGVLKFSSTLQGVPEKIHIHKGGGGDMKKKEKFVNFSPISPPPPPINNERSLT